MHPLKNKKRKMDRAEGCGKKKLLNSRSNEKIQNEITQLTPNSKVSQIE